MNTISLKEYDYMNEIQELRKQTGLSQSKFAKIFNIPTRTLQKWEIDVMKPPIYVVELMKFKLEHVDIKDYV